MVERHPLDWLNEDPSLWEEEPLENFLDHHLLYRGIPRSLWNLWEPLTLIHTNCFLIKTTEKGLSFNWSKYSTPEFTLNNLPQKEKGLSFYGIMEANVGRLKSSIIELDFFCSI